MKTTLIVVRHGNSVTNATNTFTGHLDAPLSEKGIEQAHLTARYLKDFNIDKIYSSDLKRAYDTALCIAQFHNLSVEKNEKLREIFAGDWEGKLYKEIVDKYPKQYNNWMNDVANCEPENGETVKDFFERIKKAFFDISKKNKGKTVCIATHATPIRVLKAVSIGKNVFELNDIKACANASISIFEYENNNIKLLKYGIADHLGENVTVFPNCI